MKPGKITFWPERLYTMPCEGSLGSEKEWRCGSFTIVLEKASFIIIMFANAQLFSLLHVYNYAITTKPFPFIQLYAIRAKMRAAWLQSVDISPFLYTYFSYTILLLAVVEKKGKERTGVLRLHKMRWNKKNWSISYITTTVE